MATASAYLRPGPTLLHETVGTIRRCSPSRVVSTSGSRIRAGSTCARRAGPRSSSPVVFALFVVADNSTSALFASFGSFSALVFSDFGGPLPAAFPRLRPAGGGRRGARGPRHRLRRHDVAGGRGDPRGRVRDLDRRSTRRLLHGRGHGVHPRLRAGDHVARDRLRPRLSRARLGRRRGDRRRRRGGALAGAPA